MAYLMAGIKRGRVLVYHEYRYQKNRATNNKIYWRCWNQTCRAPLITDVFDLDDRNAAIQVLEFKEHDHPTDTSRIDAGKVFNNVRKAIQDDPTKPIKRTFDEVLALHDNSDAEELPGYSQVRTRLQRVRANMLPALPEDILDVDIQGEWGLTWRGDRYLSHLDNDWGIAIFSSDQNLRILRRCDKIYIDGTFKTCPRPYAQYVTVHGKYLDHVFTLAMCLLTGKTVGHYRQMLQHIKTQVRNISGHRWRPGMVICDFENALILAIETELPQTQIRVCYFHFCQSLWRKIQAIGLANPYKRRRRLRRILRKFMAIGHLPVALVRPNFNLLSRERATQRLVNRYPALGEFIAHLSRTYIQGTFPIPMWNVYQRGHDCRTNNIVEGFHSRWNEGVSIKHPSIWIFIRKLKDEERRERLRLRRVQQGHIDNRRKRKWRHLENRVNLLRTQYRNGVRHLDDFWTAISYVVKDYR